MTPRPPAAGPTWPGLGRAHVLLTGATGFLGQGLLERLLVAHPDTRISVLIRPQALRSGEERMRDLLDRPAFGPWRNAVGPSGVDRAMHDRITVIEGDLGSVTELPSDLDVVLHSASSVSFDQPVDDAFRTNVLGTHRLYQALLDSGADPHVVHISTAYVNGGRRGAVTEGSLEHSLDWRSESDAVQTARSQAEAESRRPEFLSDLHATMLRLHGRIGPQAAAAATEQARAKWVNDRLVTQGRARAQSLGWTDVYTLTKACAERVGEQSWARSRRRLSFVRPAIIESAVRQPFPGWLDGIKVLDPLLLAYGRGMLRTFPGRPDTVIDVVPIDVVVNAVLAVAGTCPGRDGAAYFHLSSGSRNPLPMHELCRISTAYFAEHPQERDGRPVPASSIEFPGDRRFQRQLRTRERLVGVADGLVAQLPSGPRSRHWTQEITARSRALKSLRLYSELYHPYVKTEVVFDDRRTKALHDSLPESAKATFGFDVGLIDWNGYLRGTHIPAVTQMAKTFARTKPAAPSARAVSMPRRHDALAVFDLMGTVVELNLLEQYLAVRLSQLPKRRWPGEVARLIATGPGLVMLARRDRSEYVRTLTRRHQGLQTQALDDYVARRFRDVAMRNSIAPALEKAEQHRAAGHRTVLITGAPSWAAEPFAHAFDEIISGQVHLAGGSMTGYLTAAPFVGESRANWLRTYAASTGTDLSASYGYGDSYADVAWLELVGTAHAINPDARLYRHARQANWIVEDWK